MLASCANERLGMELGGLVVYEQLENEVGINADVWMVTARIRGKLID